MRVENIVRIIGYLILYAICGMLYYFLHSHFYFIVMVIMTVAPFLSVFMAFVLRKKLTAQIVQGVVSMENAENVSVIREPYGRQKEEFFFCLKLNNPTFFVSLDVKLTLEIENTFFETSGERIISVPVRAKKGYELSIPLMPTLPGIIKISLKKIYIKDLMGFCFLGKKMEESAEATVLPKALETVQYDKLAAQEGMLESEESNKRGNDFSDVQEIREYIPGDKLMSIHWKLSAKRDILMVKDRVSMSDKQLVIVPELYGADVQGLNMVVSAAYSIILQMLEEHTTIRLLFWSKNRYDYGDEKIEYKQDADEAFAKMFYEKKYDVSDEAASHMANVHPEMRAYLYINADNRKVNVQVKENG